MECTKDKAFNNWNGNYGENADWNGEQTEKNHYLWRKNNKIVMILLTLGLICGIINIALIIQFVRLL